MFGNQGLPFRRVPWLGVLAPRRSAALTVEEVRRAGSRFGFEQVSRDRWCGVEREPEAIREAGDKAFKTPLRAVFIEAYCTTYCEAADLLTL